MKFLPSFLFSFYLLSSILYPPVSHAIVNPPSVPNNKVGIHIISASPDEINPASEMVNTNGDWGYVTVLIETGDREDNKWQEVFDVLRRKHLIPIVRLATHPDGNHWVKPYPDEEQSWAEFLDKLNWPTKNRYVIVYNEPNHATEWGNSTDPANYAQTLDKTITALKKRSEDFFVLNAGLDASAPQKLPNYMDELEFIKAMNDEIPGIFEKLDGWVSHSYPNPGFIGSPEDQGRGSIKTWVWEIQVLKNLGVNKILPIFITETGWKHSEGKNLDNSLPSAQLVASYYKQSFTSAWASSRIVAVTPFLLNYQEPPFDHFSFKKYTGGKQNSKILSVEYPDYYPQYQTIKDLSKIKGQPIQENKLELIKGEVYSNLVAGQSYQIPLTLKNIGQSIWGDNEQTVLIATQDAPQLSITPVPLPQGIKVEPGQDYTFNLNLKAPQKGVYKIALNLYQGQKEFGSPPLKFTTEIKAPVILKVKASLKWKNNFEGNYFLSVIGAIKDTITQVTLTKSGESEKFENRYLLPNYSFDFTLEKPFYKPKTIRQKVTSGVNLLDFGELQPDISSAILNPKKLWELLPLSN